MWLQWKLAIYFENSWSDFHIFGEEFLLFAVCLSIPVFAELLYVAFPSSKVKPLRKRILYHDKIILIFYLGHFLRFFLEVGRVVNEVW